MQNIKFVERYKIDSPNTQMHDRSLRWLDIRRISKSNLSTLQFSEAELLYLSVWIRLGSN